MTTMKTYKGFSTQENGKDEEYLIDYYKKKHTENKLIFVLWNIQSRRKGVVGTNYEVCVVLEDK